MCKDYRFWGQEKLEDIIKGDIHDSFFFECYNNYVYNSPSASKYMWSRIANIKSWEYIIIRLITPGRETVSRSELYAWIAVCIYRRVAEKYYVPYLLELPSMFLEIINEYLYKYSPISLDIDEESDKHKFINDLIEKNFAKIKNLENEVVFTKLLNDVRFGFVNESIYEDRILAYDKVSSENKIEMLIMAASKANNKSLVKKLAHHRKYQMMMNLSLYMMVELKVPHSFKVYFDMIEGGVFHDGCIRAIMRNKFKVTKVTTANLLNKFEIQSPIEYVEHGFLPNYDVFVSQGQDILIPLQQAFVEKMFNDAAKADAEEFIQVITEHCGEHVIESNFIHFQRFEVSYEVIQILLEHQELIGMLANRSVKLLCRDERINPDEIVNFRHVINPA